MTGSEHPDKGISVGIVGEEVKDEVFTILLQRPNAKNALNVDLIEGLSKALRNAENSGSNIVVLRGSGKVFSAGGDVAEMAGSMDVAKQLDQGASALSDCLLRIRRMDAIVVTVLEGFVVGAAVGLMLASDLSIATRTSFINLGFRRVGLTPDTGVSLMLPRIVGAKRFNEMYLLSDNIGMSEAKNMGLVNFVYEEDGLEEGLEEIIARLKKLPSETIGRFKALVNDALYPDLESHLDKEKAFIMQLGRQTLFKDRLSSLRKK